MATEPGRTKVRVSWPDDGRPITFPPVCVVTGEPADGFVRTHFDDTPFGAPPKWQTTLWQSALSRYKSLALDIALDSSFYVRLPASREAAAKASRRHLDGWLWLLTALVVGLTAAATAVGAAFLDSYLVMVVAVPLLVMSYVTTGRGHRLLLTNDVTARREGNRLTLTPHPLFAEALVQANPPGTIETEHIQWDAPRPTS